MGSRARRLLALAGAAGAILIASIYGASEVRLRRSYVPRLEPVAVPGGAEQIALGRRLTHAVTQCAFCHGDDLGGKLVADAPLFGRLWAPNLTRGAGGLGNSYRDRDFVRALRHGLDRRGRPLALMPSDQLRALGDADLAAIVAYLRSASPVDRSTPGRRFGSFTRLTMVTGLAPELLSAERIDHARPPAPPPEPATTSAYGAYLVSIGTCRVCHHDDLSGGRHPLALPGEPTPPALNRAGMVDWAEADFSRAMRRGVTPSGRVLDPAYMPWPQFAGLTDLEVTALWRYLRSLPEP